MRTRKTRVLDNRREESSVVCTDNRIEMFVREKCIWRILIVGSISLMKMTECGGSTLKPA